MKIGLVVVTTLLVEMTKNLYSKFLFDFILKTFSDYFQQVNYFISFKNK